jgi:hypothetical protein
MLTAELGLRYRPARAADLEAHAAGLALLARDLADVPTPALAAAIERWARTSPFLPKACELLALVTEQAAAAADVPRGVDGLAAVMNARLDATGNPRGLAWQRDGEDLKLVRRPV